MAHFLFVTPPFAGHTLPTVSVGQHLMQLGHDVTWTGFSETLDRLLPVSAQRQPIAVNADLYKINELRQRFLDVRGFQGLKLLWEEVLIPMAHYMYPKVLDVAESLYPDVLISDQQTLAGAMVARKLGLRWATSATTPADRRVALAPYPRVLEWTDDLIRDLFDTYSLIPGEVPEDSPDLVISYYSEAFVGSREQYPAQYRFVGPSIDRRDENDDFPWDRIDKRPCVIVSLGSLNAERSHLFFRKIIKAFSDGKYQVIVIAPPSMLSFPRDFIVRSWVPMLELLKHASALVSHGGSNTVCEAICAGVPMVVLPILDAQPWIAGRVADTRCGVRLSFKRATADEIRQAVDRILSDPSYRENVQIIKRSFAEAGGSARAAALLENLAKLRTG